MSILSINKNELLRRLEMLSKESQNFIFDKISELSEAEKRDEELLKAIQLGEESGIADVDLDTHFENFFTDLDEQKKG